MDTSPLLVQLMYEDHILKGKVWLSPETATLDQNVLWNMIDPGKEELRRVQTYKVGPLYLLIVCSQ